MTTTSTAVGAWTITHDDWGGQWPAQTTAQAGGVDVTLEGDDVTIEWSEQSDDYFGTQTRRAVIPAAVLREMLKTLPPPAQPGGERGEGDE